MSKPIIRILLADDHKMLRDGLRALLEGEDDMQVVAETGTVQDTIYEATTIIPDVIVMDLGMPGGQWAGCNSSYTRKWATCANSGAFNA